jgi:transcriptional regulator with XRE-family HTH domain
MNEGEKSTLELQLAIAQRIRELRHNKSWSLERLAQETGLSKGYLSQIENREKAPSIGTLSNIAFSLGTDVRTVIAGDAEEKRIKGYRSLKLANVKL